MRRPFDVPIDGSSGPDNPNACIALSTIADPGDYPWIGRCFRCGICRAKSGSGCRRADPCSTSGARTASPSPAPWRARISRRDAVYVILHLQKACRYLAEGPDSRSASSTPQLASIFDNLHTAVLDPIYRSHPDLESAVLPVSAMHKVPRATPRDVQRTTATRMSDDLTRLQRQIYKLSTQTPDQLPDKSAAEKALQPFNDAAAELSFAQQIAFDAYPDLFAKLFHEIPQQPRTEESDAGFRKSAPPLGSVRRGPDGCSAYIGERNSLLTSSTEFGTSKSSSAQKTRRRSRERSSTPRARSWSFMTERELTTASPLPKAHHDPSSPPGRAARKPDYRRRCR